MKTLYAIALALALSLASTPAFADVPGEGPPSEGGNGAGSSKQCTGSPDGRPSVCPGT